MIHPNLIIVNNIHFFSQINELKHFLFLRGATELRRFYAVILAPSPQHKYLTHNVYKYLRVI